MSDQPDPDAPSRGELSRLRMLLRRWRAVAIVLGVLVVTLFAWSATRPTAAPAVASAGASAAFKAADDPAKLRYATEQVKAENRLLRQAQKAAKEVTAAHRHHSEVMWDLLMGKINSKEAWWQGGDSTCAGWLAANEYEVAEGKLRGVEVKPPPIPAQGLEFCKQARERK